MSAIIEVNNNWMEYQSHRVYPEVWNEDTEDTHWIAIPPEFESDIVNNAPYIDVTYSEDKESILSVKILPRPEPTPPVYHPSETDKIILSMISNFTFWQKSKF